MDFMRLASSNDGASAEVRETTAGRASRRGQFDRSPVDLYGQFDRQSAPTVA
jgi:hypothetical protein